MARRVIGWIADLMRDPYAEPEAHFHRGPESVPAVCHDARCGSPRLEIGTG